MIIVIVIVIIIIINSCIALTEVELFPQCWEQGGAAAAEPLALRRLPAQQITHPHALLLTSLLLDL